MTAQTWRALLKAKQQLSLRLFLLLNALAAAFSMLFPLHSAGRITPAVVAILLISLTLLGWQMMNKKQLINLNFVSLFLGLFWAMHIFIKNAAIGDLDTSFLVISLMSVLFIGAISFINNIVAFLLHSLPVALVVLWLGNVDQWLRVIYSIALPAIGITIQHIIQKRNDRFTQRLMNKLLEEKETLTDLSMLDPLTGLYNRRGFQNRLEHIQASGHGSHYVLLLDIDHFKSYNDHYGHAMGDQALIRVSAAIRDAVRSRDIVTRYGGEEFMIMLTNIDAERAMQSAERIRQRVFDLDIPHMFNNQVATNVTVSIGLAPFVEGSVDDALSLADKALYQAKNRGRNSILTTETIAVN
ncbi:GGDEF domain-containing protein [Cedecea neteri]|uniref:GGDEF domain-containing protein n=1 Tax=Cedecea neteri TaxID=158822 RepID=UPI0005DA3758|nr:GGDEF domain-containing protein [Cedecea neteri]AJZ88070.1 diguanylate cyclase [Klebsiella michiganensis]WPU22442.1 GGDEF domain-containing protein [Cedecea neteri]